MSAEAASTDIRSTDRTHLFLVATLTFGAASVMVKVRNLSPSGALIEGRDLPSAGTDVILTRGSLEASGRAVWVDAGRAGLAFTNPVAVGAWLPTREAAARVPTESQTPREVTPTPNDSSRPPSTAGAVASDLATLLRELTELGQQLRSDPSTLARYPQLRWFDVAAQRIIRMIDTLQHDLK
jgi:hypothetical protein